MTHCKGLRTYLEFWHPKEQGNYMSWRKMKMGRNNCHNFSHFKVQ